MPPIVNKERFTNINNTAGLQTSTGAKDLHTSTGYTGLLECAGRTDLRTLTRCTGLLQLIECIGLMRGTTLQTFGRDTVFTVKIVGAFKTETRRGQKWDLTTLRGESNGMNLTLTFTTSIGDTTEMEWRDKKDLHKTWLTASLLIGTNSDYMICYIAIAFDSPGSLSFFM